MFRFVAVRLVEGFGPFALGDRLAGKLVEGLPSELTGPAHADQVDLAAADVHGGDAAIAFHIESALVTENGLPLFRHTVRLNMDPNMPM